MNVTAEQNRSGAFWFIRLAKMKIGWTTLRIEKLANRIIKAVLLVIAMSSSTMVAGAVGLPPYVDQTATIPPLGGIILAQAQGNTSTDQSIPSDCDLAEENNSDLLEDLLSQFLEDPAGFIANPNNTDIIADIVRQAIARNPANVDAVIAAIDSLSNSSIIGAVAEGIAQAAADYAAACDTAASSQILAKASIATSTVLKQAVQDKASEIATEMAGVIQSLQDEDVALSEQETPTDTQEGMPIEETEATLSEGETLSEPVADAPSLSNAPGASGGSDSTTLPSGGTISPPPPVGTANPPVTVTPSQGGVPASPA